jgi:hypothetical protein
MGGTPPHDRANDRFSATLKCHDLNGEVYSVTFTRDRIIISSYADDAIMNRVANLGRTVCRH